MSEYVWPTILLGMGVISAWHSKTLMAFIGIGGGGSAALLLAMLAHSATGAYAAFDDSTLVHAAGCVIVKGAVERHDSRLVYFKSLEDAERAGLSPHRCAEEQLLIHVTRNE